MYVLGERFYLAVRNGRPGEGSGLSTRKVVSQRKVFCASPSYLAEHGHPQDIADLVSHDSLVYWRNERLFPWSFSDASGAIVEAQLRWRLQFDSQEAMSTLPSRARE